MTREELIETLVETVTKKQAAAMAGVMRSIAKGGDQDAIDSGSRIIKKIHKSSHIPTRRKNLHALDTLGQYHSTYTRSKRN